MQICHVNGFNQSNGQSLSNNIAQSLNVVERERRTRKARKSELNHHFLIARTPLLTQTAFKRHYDGNQKLLIQQNLNKRHHRDPRRLYFFSDLCERQILAHTQSYIQDHIRQKISGNKMLSRVATLPFQHAFAAWLSIFKVITIVQATKAKTSKMQCCSVNAC